MTEFTELLENFWFLRENDSGEYFRIRRAADDKMRKFLNEFVGWNIISNNKLVKLEKTPAEAKPFMGIPSFENKNDYCLLCALLIYLDDKFDGEQFLLTEMIESMEKIIGSVIEIDFTKFSDRKSLVRVLKFAQNISLLKISDGSIENLENDRDKQILYENTGLSAYFSVNHNIDIFDFTSYRDFEKHTDLYTDNNTGYARTNRVYKRLLLQPAMYWESKDDKDSIYLKNQRNSVRKYLDGYLGGRLDIHNGAAFYMLDETDTFGKIHPSDNALSGFVSLMCKELRSFHDLSLPQNDTHKYPVSTERFHTFILECKKKYENGLGKQLREMSDNKFISLVTEYFSDWMLIEKTENGYNLCDGIYKTEGHFPENYQFNKTEEV